MYQEGGRDPRGHWRSGNLLHERSQRRRRQRRTHAHAPFRGLVAPCAAAGSGPADPFSKDEGPYSVMSSTITEQLATTLATSIEEPLARLVAFEPTTFPVLSVYLNTQPDQHGRMSDALPYLHREFKALARTWAPSSPERHSFEQDVERIVSYATDKIDPAANGVAIFACWGAEEFFEAVQLTTPVSDNCVYAYNQPHLYHLAHLDEQYPRYAAVLTDTNTARI